MCLAHRLLLSSGYLKTITRKNAPVSMYTMLSEKARVVMSKLTHYVTITVASSVSNERLKTLKSWVILPMLSLTPTAYS